MLTWFYTHPDESRAWPLPWASAFLLLSLCLHDKIRTKVAWLITEEAMYAWPFSVLFHQKANQWPSCFPPIPLINADEHVVCWCTGKARCSEPHPNASGLTWCPTASSPAGPSLQPLEVGFPGWFSHSHPEVGRDCLAIATCLTNRTNSMELVLMHFWVLFSLISIGLPQKLTGCCFSCGIFVMLNNRFLSQIQNPHSMKRGWGIEWTVPYFLCF
jgi:hypothetical protein